MAPTMVQGMRLSTTQRTETANDRDVFPALLKVDPNAGPLTVLGGKLRKESCQRPKFEWFEKEHLPVQDVFGAAYGAADATFTATNYKYFRAGDILLVMETGEQILVTATPSTTAVTATRAWGEVSAAAATNGSKLKIIGSASEEGDTSRDVLSTQKAPKYNLVGIIRDPFELSNTAKLSRTYAGMDFEIEAAEMLWTHLTKIERMNLEGQRYEDTSGTEPRRASRGIKNWISTTVVNIGGGLTEPAFDAFLRRLFRHGNEKILLNAPIVTQAISGFAKDRLQVSDVMMKKYGMSTNQYISPFGVAMLANHKLFENDDLTDFDGLAGTSIGVDISNIRIRHMEGRISVRKQNIQANDKDSRKDEYLTEMGLQVGLEETHGKMTGITG